MGKYRQPVTTLNENDVMTLFLGDVNSHILSSASGEGGNILQRLEK